MTPVNGLTLFLLRIIDRGSISCIRRVLANFVFKNHHLVAMVVFFVVVNISVVNLSETVTTLCVNLDQTLSLQQHVSNLCKSSYYLLRALRHIRASLPDDICFSLATALIQSRLDYSNSILYGTSASNLHKLQMVQNALARTITRSPRSVSTSAAFVQPSLAPNP